jgi:hypothetical protein
METEPTNFRPVLNGKPVAPPELRKAIHLFTMAECQKGADEYFLPPNRAEFKKRRINGRLTYFCCTVQGQRVLGKGNSYGEALVDAFSTAEKKKAQTQLEAKQAAQRQEATQAEHDKQHPIKAAARRLRNLFRS